MKRIVRIILVWCSLGLLGVCSLGAQCNRFIDDLWDEIEDLTHDCAGDCH